MLDLIVWVQAIALILQPAYMVVSSIEILGPLELIFMWLSHLQFPLIGETWGLVSNNVVIVDVYNHVTLILPSNPWAQSGVYAIINPSRTIVHLINTFQCILLGVLIIIVIVSILILFTIIPVISTYGIIVIIWNHVGMITTGLLVTLDRIAHNLFEIKSAFQACRILWKWWFMSLMAKFPQLNLASQRIALLLLLCLKGLDIVFKVEYFFLQS